MPSEQWLFLKGYLKRFAAVRHVHYGAAAALALPLRLAQRLRDISRIALHVYAEALTYCANRAPARPIQAQFSLSYGVARAPWAIFPCCRKAKGEDTEHSLPWERGRASALAEHHENAARLQSLMMCCRHIDHFRHIGFRHETAFAPVSTITRTDSSAIRVVSLTSEQILHVHTQRVAPFRPIDREQRDAFMRTIAGDRLTV